MRSATQICVMTRHQYGISALVSHTSFRRETTGGVEICRQFFQATGKKGTVNSLNITWLGVNYAGEYHQLALRSESYLAWLISKDPLLQNKKKGQLLFTMHIYNATMWPN